MRNFFVTMRHFHRNVTIYITLTPPNFNSVNISEIYYNCHYIVRNKVGGLSFAKEMEVYHVYHDFCFIS